MSAANELTNQIINHIYTAGGYAWRSTTTGLYDTKQARFRTASKKGVADVLACYNGRLVAVEVKIGKDRLSDEQVGFLENVKNAGGTAYVARNFETFKEWWTMAFPL